MNKATIAKRKQRIIKELQEFIWELFLERDEPPFKEVGQIVDEDSRQYKSKFEWTQNPNQEIQSKVDNLAYAMKLIQDNL